MLVKEVTRRSYAITISLERYKQIEEAESFKNIGTCGPTVCEQLEKLDGVCNVEYNAHFGIFIYLAVTDEDDTDETWEQIEAIIFP